MEFDYYDSCLLTAVCMTAGTEKGADLEAIISYIDHVDHSIIAWKEVSSGLIKLKHIGAVMIKDKKVFLSGKFDAWWPGYYQNKRRLSDLKLIDEVSGYLDKTFASSPDPHHDEKIEITEKDLLMALKAYKKS